YTIIVSALNGCTYEENITVENRNQQDPLLVTQKTNGNGNTKLCERALVEEIDKSYRNRPKAVWSYNGEPLYDSFDDIPWEMFDQNAVTFEIDYEGEGEYVFITY